MNKKIGFSYEGTDYVLEYNRDAVLYMEAEGLNVSEVKLKPLTTIELLWRGAFLKNHKKESMNKIQKMYSDLKNKEDLNAALVEMYYETYTSLLGGNEEESEDDSKNIEWKMS